MKNLKNKKMIILLIIILIMFLSIILYLTYFQLFKSNKLANHPYNMRNWVDENLIVRGSILDRNDRVLTYSVKDSEGKSMRINEYSYMYSSIIGYNSEIYGKSGIESSYNKYLLNIYDSQNVIEKLKEMSLKNTKGNDVKLTIDNDLQAYAYGLLENHKGAIVVMDPKSGEILSMVSRPTFDINNLEANWNQLIESKDSILINRASQGLYTPGSVFKVLTATSILENKVDLDYDDKGSVVIDGYKFKNYNEIAHGPISMREALIHSSNAYFIEKGMQVPVDKLEETSKNFYLGRDYSFDLPRSLAQIPYGSKMSKTDFASVLFGQGKTLITPLDMTMIMAALGNDGLLMSPKIVSNVVDPDGDTILENKNKELGRATSYEIAEEIRDYLKSVVDYNKSIYVPGVEVGGKSGTAENSTGKSHSWYTAMMPIENPQYVVTVLLESEGDTGSQASAPIANKILNFINGNL